jgi:hypothetical protein
MTVYQKYTIYRYGYDYGNMDMIMGIKIKIYSTVTTFAKLRG